MTKNVFEVQLSRLANVQIGFYYGKLSGDPSAPFTGLTDLRVFDPAECESIRNCVVSKHAPDPSDPDFNI